MQKSRSVGAAKIACFGIGRSDTVGDWPNMPVTGVALKQVMQNGRGVCERHLVIAMSV